MLKTLDDLLFYSVKITDKGGGQILNKALGNHINNLEKLGINDAHEKVNSLFEDDKYDYVNDENLNNQQRHTFAHAHNTIVFAMAISIKNIDNDEQKEIILKLSRLVSNTFKSDKDLQSYIENINLQVEDGDLINLRDINFELIDITKNRIKSDKALQLEIVQLMIENFEILVENKVECRSEFMEFLSENEEVITSEILKDEVHKKIIQLKAAFTQQNSYSPLEIVNTPVKVIRSFVERLGCSRRNRQQPWIKRINEGEISTQRL